MFTSILVRKCPILFRETTRGEELSNEKKLTIATILFLLLNVLFNSFAPDENNINVQQHTLTIKELRRLVKLDTSDNQIANISSLKVFTSIKTLDVSNNNMDINFATPNANAETISSLKENYNYTPIISTMNRVIIL